MSIQGGPNYAKCSVCKEQKEHIDSGMITVSGKLAYIDSKTGLTWEQQEGKKNLKVCPDCLNNARTEKGLTLLKKDSRLFRSCKNCNRVLTLRRARVCEYCQPELGDETDYLYCEDPELGN